MRALALPLPRVRSLAGLLLWLELARAHSAAGAALAVWVGARLAGAGWAAWWLAPMAVAGLLSAAGNAWNDTQDAASDRVNRPRRPIPRGAVTVAGARRFAAGASLAALALALPFGAFSVGGTVAGIALLVAYSTHLKGVPVLGNGVVGLLAGMAMGYGGWLAGDVPAALWPAIALGLLFGGRELLKTIPDRAGDGATGTRTVATLAGPRGALAAALLCGAGGVAALGRGGIAGPLLVGVAALCLGALAPLARCPTEARALRWALAGSKIAGLLVLGGLALA